MDFAVGASRNDMNKVFVYSGALIRSRTGATLASRTILATEAMQEVQREGNSSTATQAFGHAMVGERNFLGDAKPDLAVSYPLGSRVRLIPAISAGFGTTDFVIQGGSASQRFGYSLKGGDINGDGLPDLVVGREHDDRCHPVRVLGCFTIPGSLEPSSRPPCQASASVDSPRVQNSGNFHGSC